ncbi:MAG: endolytic transglycosylase MltG [Candidatus Marinimicrobia bacterium]|nr:endolytic transglycosylase MltG [Candidatus Neomarinimicrobiota bacterium]
MAAAKFEIDYKIKVGGGITLLIVIGALLFYSIILGWEIDCREPSDLISIPKGASAQSVAALLRESSCLQNESIFKLALTLTMKNKHIIPGRYNVKGISSIGQLVKMITSQSSDRVKITLIEGWPMERYAEALNKELKIDTYEFLRLCKDYNFIHSLGIDAPSLEGFLAPDTYILLRTYTEENIIRIMVNQFNHNMQRIKESAPSVHLNKREITTLASIIQGEAMFLDEMPTISSVYNNRLKKGMLLQADPTIQYILPGKPRRLYNKHLKVDDPYNTYKYKGLPPGPINNPGYSALYAAAHPSQTSYLYFVADGEGRHIFSNSNEEHNQAKLILKQNRRKKRKL